MSTDSNGGWWSLPWGVRLSIVLGVWFACTLVGTAIGMLLSGL